MNSEKIMLLKSYFSWKNLLNRHHNRVQVLRHFATQKVIGSHPYKYKSCCFTCLYDWPVGGADVWLTCTAEGPSSTVEVHNPPLQLVPPHRMKDPRGNAAKCGVCYLHGVTGASLDFLHPGHNPVQQVDPVANTQSVSSITLNTSTNAVGGRGGTLLRVGQRFKYVHTQLQWDKNRLLKLWTTAPHWPKVTWFMGYSVGLFVHDWLRLTVFKTLVLLSKCAEKPAGLQRDQHVQRVQHVKVQHVITGKAKQWWTKVLGTYILISVHVCTVVKHTYKHLRECKSDHQHSKWRDWSNLLSLKPFNVRYNGCLTKYKVVVDFTERSFLSLLLPYSIFKLILSYIIFDIHRFDRHRCYPMNDQLLLLEFPDPSSVTSTCPWCILKPLPPAWSSWIAHPAASASTARWLRSVAANRRNRRPPTAARLRLTGASSQRRELSTAHLGSARPGWSVGVFAKARRNRRNALNFKIRRQTLGLHPFHCSDGGNRLI